MSDLDMYVADEDAEDENEPLLQFDAKTRGHTVELVIDGRKVSVPHVDHVAALERQLLATEGLIRQLRSEVIRLSQTVREHAGGMHEIRRNLNNKFDRG